MKRVIFMIAVCAGMLQFSNCSAQSDNGNNPKKESMVEVLYFHGKQRCASCLAIENGTRELLENVYADKLRSGEIVFKSVNISENEALADKYEISWSSLLIVDYDEKGKESVMNLTDFGFTYARSAPEKFQSGLSAQISKMLNN
jgi:hypothetical protein